MAIIHELNCGTTRRNVGFGHGCPLDWKLIQGAIFWDQPMIFEAGWLANLQTWLQLNAWQDSAAGRAYPISNFVNPEDGTGKPVIQTFSDASKAKVLDTPYDWTFQFTQGGFPLLQALQTHNGNSTEYAIFYDRNNNVLGTLVNGKFAAIPLQIFDAEPWMMNDGSKTAAYKVHFVFAKKYSNEQAEYFNAGFDLSQIVGLEDIRTVVNGFNPATGMANVTFITENGGQNLYSLFAADFNSTTVKASNGDTGAAIAITTITPLPASQTWNVQVLHSDANYPSDGNVVLTLAAPSILTANGMAGFAGEGAVLLEVTSS